MNVVRLLRVSSLLLLTMPMVVSAQSLNLQDVVGDIFAKVDHFLPVFGPLLMIGAAILIAQRIVSFIIFHIIWAIQDAIGED